MATSKSISRTFNFPAQEVSRLDEIQDKLLSKKIVLNKSEVVRLGLLIMSEMSVEKLSSYLANLERAQWGRPKLSDK
jgi:hypothetical protein